MVASSLKDSPEAVTPISGLDSGLLRVAAIYGANASGKTNIIKALQWMAGAVENSHRNWPPEGPIPRDPFLLDAHSKSAPSSFEVDLLIDRVRFNYGFTVNDSEVLTEWLRAYPTDKSPMKRQTWLKREMSTYVFGKKLIGDNHAIERLTRPNSLFLSAAAQNNHEALLPIYKWFAEQFTHVPVERGYLRMRTAEMCQDEGFRSSLHRILKAADLGVVGVDVHLEDAFLLPQSTRGDAEERALLKEVIGAIRKLAARVKERDPSESPLWDKKPVLALIHKGSVEGGVALGEGKESNGTLAFFGLSGPVLLAIKSGLTICIDELDASLHPLLALEVVRLFNDPKLNPQGAQIIFTTHDTNILDRASLRRDQIWFTEKDAEGGTHLYPLTDFKPRKNENLERGYLQGRYGAIPFLGSTNFLVQSPTK